MCRSVINSAHVFSAKRFEMEENEECPDTLRHLGYYEKNLSKCVMLNITCLRLLYLKYTVNI